MKQSKKQLGNKNAKVSDFTYTFDKGDAEILAAVNWAKEFIGAFGAIQRRDITVTYEGLLCLQMDAMDFDLDSTINAAIETCQRKVWLNRLVAKGVDISEYE